MKKRILTSIIALTLGLIITSTSQVSAANLSKRLSGTNRYETGCKIVREGWTSSDYAIIASGEGFADALCSAPLAKKYNAPILLTGKDKLDLNTKNELKRLNVRNVFIVGGAGVISENIKDELTNMNIKATRISGKNRFETSVQVAKNLENFNGVVITNGFGFADALSIAPVAAQRAMPILLTSKNDLPNEVKELLKNTDYDISYIVGGSQVVSNKIASSLKNNIRLEGKNRYATNSSVLNHFNSEFNYDKVYISSGENYPDALSGSALAALSNSSLVLVGKSVDPLVMDSVDLIYNKIKNLIVLGGESVVSNSVANKILMAKETVPIIPIVGKSKVTVETMKNWAKSRGATEKFINVADLYFKYGELTGIRADVLYAQSAKETAFGKFGGAVTEDMNNFAGIKIKNAIGDKKEDHETFATPEDGVRAHFNHIAAYCGVNPVGQPHPRYFVVKSCSWSGNIKTVGELAGKYCPNPAYSRDLINNFLNDLLRFK
ncbi:cell wall-binding repeat-containing protein [Clostridium cochlearium]|uniref:cell wall-binding repeat-containing protein n=1 Tax=Clostridium cochlearium TaxID=1494 RepID=UPI001EDDD620|nr:cell wall-binding repeat-containing protein [Clostridium cochlearium]